MDRFAVVRQVGQGAFGRALMVRHKHGGDPRLYVIKEISLRQLSARDKDASRKEVTLLSKMKHPNIVAFYESFHERNHLYILMEYCDSGDLMNRIKMQRGKPFSEQQIVDWLVQICLGLKHIHDRKVLHRDIKAQNIFLTHGGLKAKLGDFGIARMLDSTMELVRTCVGTPYYLSPEICESKPYNNKTDIWSLGCVLYELCALRHPFEGSNLKQLVLRICRGRYSPVSQRYSSELRLMLKQLFRVSPRDRPSANSLLRRPILHTHIHKHLHTQLLEEEFSHTVLHRNPPAAHNTDHVRCSAVPKPSLVRPAARDLEVKAPGPALVSPSVEMQERRQEPDHSHPRAAAEPYRLVVAARDEYLQRRREAHQYKLRAQKQLGLRPSTADAEGCTQANAQEHHGNRPAPRQRGQEEYLQQLQRIREQYHHDVRQMRMRAEVKETVGTEPPNNRHRKQQRGIMFEIKLTEDQMKTEDVEESEEEEPLNNTLTFTQGENLRKQDQGSEVREEVEEEVKRAQWNRDAAQSLRSALENMNTSDSISDMTVTVSDAQEEGNRKQWTDRLPETLLNALAHAQLTHSTAETLLSSEESDGDDDVDEEPRSDDEDTNFEESEDELRAEVSDSMRNLLTSQEMEEEEEEEQIPEKPPHITGAEDGGAEGEGAAEGGAEKGGAAP